jgi:hypothetical protein
MMDPSNAPSGPTILQIGMAKPPPNVAKLVARWNKANAPEFPAHGVSVMRPNGLKPVVQLAMRAPSGMQTLSLGATDDATVKAALEHLWRAVTGSAPDVVAPKF